MNRTIVTAVAASALLCACANDADEAAEDRIENQAEASAAAAGATVAALGLTEAQLLDAELLGANGAEIADVARIERAADGTVDRLLVEIEDSNPDRYVHVPITGLTPQQRGDDTDLASSLSREDLMALPEVSLTQAAPAPAN